MKTRKSKSVFYLLSGLIFLFLIAVFYLHWQVDRYQHWLSTPAVVVFTAKSSIDSKDSAIVVMNLQADLESSQLILIKGKIPDNQEKLGVSKALGILISKVIILDQKPLEIDAKNLKGFLLAEAYRQITQFKSDYKYSLLALRLMAQNEPYVIKNDGANSDYWVKSG